MSPSPRRTGHDGLEALRRAEAAQAAHQIASTDPRCPSDNLVSQLVNVGRASNFMSEPHRRLLRNWLLSYLQPLLETIDGQEFILEVERQQPTEGTEA